MATLQLAIDQQFLGTAGPRSLNTRVDVVMGKRLGALSAFHAEFTYALANAYIIVHFVADAHTHTHTHARTRACTHARTHTRARTNERTDEQTTS